MLYELLVYHFHVAPVPRLPPVWVSVVGVPLHIVGTLTDKPVGAAES